MNLDHYFVHMSKSTEDQKKRSSPKLEEFLSRNRQVKTKKKKRSSPKLEDHSQIIGGDISPPISAPQLYGNIYAGQIWTLSSD